MAPPPARLTRPGVRAVVAAMALALTTAACGAGTAARARLGSDEQAVVTSFYPLQFATQQITGGAVPVSVLTKPGAEPHDLELAPQDIARMSRGEARRLRRRLPAGRRRRHCRGPADSGARRRGRGPPVPHPRRGVRTGGRDRTAARRPWPRGQRPALLARPPALRGRRPGHRRASGEGRPGPRGDIREEHGDLRRQAHDARRRAPVRPRVRAARRSSSPATPPSATSPQRYGLQQHGITGISPDAEPSAVAGSSRSPTSSGAMG